MVVSLRARIYLYCYRSRWNYWWTVGLSHHLYGVGTRYLRMIPEAVYPTMHFLLQKPATTAPLMKLLARTGDVGKEMNSP